uniref:Uncharacterized protein n=1 Tax=Callorhinchus milii TaxID=7868 RepID=A0A4W3GU34_CALMI
MEAPELPVPEGLDSSAVSSEDSFFSFFDIFLFSLIAAFTVYWFFFRKKKEEIPDYRPLQTPGFEASLQPVNLKLRMGSDTSMI